MQRLSSRQLALVTAGLALAFVAWDASRLDLALASLSGDSSGFALRENWFLINFLHQGGRSLAWLVALVMCVGAWWPFGWFKKLSGSQRLQLAVTTLLALLAVNVVKALTGISCPWDEAQFGGVARHASHWAHIFQPDGGSGRCFPAGHASAGFGFLGGWFVFRKVDVHIARIWLVGAIAAGLVFGIAQQLRGAHFMSHTLWTAWLCWAVAFGTDCAWDAMSRRGVILPEAEIV